MLNWIWDKYLLEIKQILFASKLTTKEGHVVHAFYPSPGEAMAVGSLFEASLVCIVNSRTTRATLSQPTTQTPRPHILITS